MPAHRDRRADRRDLPAHRCVGRAVHPIGTWCARTMHGELRTVDTGEGAMPSRLRAGAEMGHHPTRRASLHDDGLPFLPCHGRNVVPMKGSSIVSTVDRSNEVQQESIIGGHHCPPLWRDPASPFSRPTPGAREREPVADPGASAWAWRESARRYRERGPCHAVPRARRAWPPWATASWRLPIQGICIRLSAGIEGL